MKKLCSVLSLVFLLNLTACSQQAQASDAGFQPQPPIAGIQWGMMPGEVVEILALPEECIQNAAGGVAVIQCEDVDVFGQNADVEMTFDAGTGIGLLNVRVNFSDFSGEPLMETLSGIYGDCSMMNAEGTIYMWEREKVEDLPERVQERFRHMWVDYLPEDAGQGSFSRETVWNGKKSQALVTVTLNRDTLNYYGGNMAAYLIYDDDAAYEQLQSSRNGK